MSKAAAVIIFALAGLGCLAPATARADEAAAPFGADLARLTANPHRLAGFERGSIEGIAVNDSQSDACGQQGEQGVTNNAGFHG